MTFKLNMKVSVSHSKQIWELGMTESRLLKIITESAN